MMKLSGTALSGICALLSSCSLLAPSTQEVAFFSDPDGAQVYHGSTLIGTTPLSYPIPRGDRATIVFRLHGYETATRSIASNLGTVGVVDAFGGCLFLLPWLGLLSNGAYELSPTAIAVTMHELSPAAPTNQR
ncbi:MAG: PEGA domain-containing protein [Planctomycetota bacterium]